MVNQAAKSISFSENGCQEVFFALPSESAESFFAEANHLMDQYGALQKGQDCGMETEVMLRFHLSDIATQAPVLREIIGARDSFVSFVGQPPVDGARLALEAYHIKNAAKFEKKVINTGTVHELDLCLKNYQMLYHCCRQLKPADSFHQTEEECKTLNDALEKRQATFMDNCIRTWFYGRDIDNNYAGVVDARREYFKTIGMTKETHFVASTGIEGQCEDPCRLVGLDALSLFGQNDKQIEFMEVLDYMPPTYTYNVTFERGTRITFGDRSHYYISGTASIDAQGNVLYPGDVSAQTRRMVETVDALLKRYGSSLAEMKIANVYLRDNADAPLVAGVLEEVFPHTLPRIMVKAPVCRPGWLVEMDGLAINNSGDDKFKPFQ